VIAVRTALCATAGSVDFVTRRAQYKGSDSDEMGGVASALDTAAQDAWRRKFVDKFELRAGNVTAADPFVHYAVPCMQLSSLLSALHVARVDIFWLDVEGSELTVLQSIDFSSISIGLLVVELRVANAKVNAQIRSLLRQAGYELVRTMKVHACVKCINAASSAVDILTRS
jgi:FkbM family methyltransferase